MSRKSLDNENLPNNVLSWYELGLPPKERKRRGHFSTPPRLAGQILDACGYTSQADLIGVRVLDPACGSGNFLVEAARRLLAFGTRTGLDQEAQATLIQRNLWGFDPDPVACFLAEMQLRAILDVGADLSCPSPIYRPGNPTAWPHQYVKLHYRARRSGPGLHIHQADALTLPWEPCIDLFVANPPYMAAKNTDLSGYQSAQQRGQADSYLLFLNLALQALRPGGWMGLVLPDPMLARANAARERARLLKDATIHHLWHLSGVFAAEVGAVVIIAQKHPPQPMHQISWQRGKWQSECVGARFIAPAGWGGADRTHHEQWQSECVGARFIAPAGWGGAHAPSCGSHVPQTLLLHQPGAEFRYLLSTAGGAAIEQLRSHMDATPPLPRRLAPLSEFLTISRGEELGKNSPYITASADQVPSYPILLGGIDIRPYAIPTATHYIAREAIAKPLQRYLSPKLLVVKSTDRLQATLDLQGHVALQTLYLLHPSTGENDLYFFLALLNSRLLREYVQVLHTAYKWVQPQIEQSVLARLPIPLVEADERQQIIQLARLLVDACSTADPIVEWKQDIHCIYEEQERAICRLYASVLPGLFVNVYETENRV